MKFVKEEILKNIKLSKDNIYVLLDFDKTITSYNSVDSWAVAGMAAEKGCEEEVNELYEKYRPIEIDYNIAYKEKYNQMEIWYNSCMNLYYKYHLNQNKLQEAVKNSNLVFRKGAREFLQYTYENDIPVVILSAGIGSVIKEFLKQKDSYFKNIFLISNTFIYNENGNATNLENSLIHTMNKTIKGHLFEKWEEELNKRPYRLLCGDTIEDIDMVPKKERTKTIKVAFLDEDLENLNKYQENFDIVLTKEDATFDRVKEIIKM